MNFTILRFDRLDSTNSEAARQARLGADEGLCVVAAEQTAGRGRHGRTWVSEKGSGLYFSIILRPKLEPKYLPLITLMTGVAVHDTLKDSGLAPNIKWVNDILIGDKKISGILAETAETPTGLTVIVGIGINLTSGNVPNDLANTATSIEAELMDPDLSSPPCLGGVSALRGRGGSSTFEPGAAGMVVEDFLTNHLAHFYDILQNDNGPETIINHWSSRSTYFSGKPVRVTVHDSKIEGTTDGLEENGALRVKTLDGSVRIIQAGDVERLREVSHR